MAERSTPRPSGAVSAEVLYKKYNLPPGTNEDAIARVLARLGDLPLSPSRSGGSPVGRAGGVGGIATNGTPKGDGGATGRKAQTPPRSPLARGSGGGSPAATRVAWSDEATADTNGSNPLSMLQGYDDDDNDHHHRRDGDTGYEVKISGGAEDLDPEERALKLLASAKASRLLSAERLAERKQALEEQGAPHPSKKKSGGGGASSNTGVSPTTTSSSSAAVPVTPKQRIGLMGRLKDETAAANARARRLETALQRRDQEVEELKVKLAAMARERSALATLKAKTTATPSSGRLHLHDHGGGGRKEAAAGGDGGTGKAKGGSTTPSSGGSGAHTKTPRKPSGETLSLSSRWRQWEFEARKGDRRIALLLKSYKQVEGKYGLTYDELVQTRGELSETKNELAATREALEDLRANFDAAEALLNEEMEGRGGLEERLRGEMTARGRAEAEGKRLTARVSELEGELATLQSQRQELLQRTVKRDHRIDGLTKKLATVTKEKETEATQRAKLEEEMIRSEERVRVLRKKVTATESKSKASEKERDAMMEELQSERQQLMMEIDIKEEECNMLAAMVSRAGSAGLKSSSAATSGAGAGAAGVSMSGAGGNGSSSVAVEHSSAAAFAPTAAISETAAVPVAATTTTTTTAASGAAAAAESKNLFLRESPASKRPALAEEVVPAGLGFGVSPLKSGGGGGKGVSRKNPPTTPPPTVIQAHQPIGADEVYEELAAAATSWRG